ncbi:MAG: ChbG/HpnK family deacetylase [Verrucomicrobiota bacterium]
MRRELVINADDLGMWEPVNAGILEAFSANRLTQASLMATGPAYERAIDLIEASGLRTGVHLVLASEWDLVRWGPLTDGQSLMSEDGTFPFHVRDLSGVADEEEVLEEFAAQVRRCRAHGVDVSHVDSHVCVYEIELLKRFVGELDLPCREIDVDEATEHPRRIVSQYCPTPENRSDKLPKLLDYVRGMREGRHMLIVHPAVPGEELQRMCSREMGERYRWATEFRITDLEVLLSQEFGDLLEEENIRLVTSACE